MTKRVSFYIDGFNFYFGIKRARSIDKNWGKCYWIDVVKLCESFLGDGQTLEKVVYFTASPMNPAKNSRQSSFLNANKLINGDKFEIVRGKYVEEDVGMRDFFVLILRILNSHRRGGRLRALPVRHRRPAAVHLFSVLTVEEIGNRQQSYQPHRQQLFPDFVNGGLYLRHLLFRNILSSFILAHQRRVDARQIG